MPDSIGPPPCQEPRCPGETHFRSGYTHCLDHDRLTVAGKMFASEPEAQGTATEDFTYYYGASCGSSRKTLRQLEEPNVMLSYATKNNAPWDAIQRLMIDSGGYSLLHDGKGEYPDTIDDYLSYVERSGAEWYMTRDVPRDVAGTHALTIETLDRASERGTAAEAVAVLQGDRIDDYLTCYHELVAADAVTPRLAIGSLKRRPVHEVVSIITTIRQVIDADTYDRAPIELHGLGVTPDVLRSAAVRRALSSADSARYISTARWRANRGEHPPNLRADEPRSSWYDVLRAYLDMRDELREVLGGGSSGAEGLADSQQATLPTVTQP